MGSFIIRGVDDSQTRSLMKKINSRFEHIEMIRLDLAWELFLGDEGIDGNGLLALPDGNPRTRWFDLNNWFHQTCSSYVDMISNTSKTIIAILPHCAPCAFEFVQRTMSIYFHNVSILNISEQQMAEGKIMEELERYFRTGNSEMVYDGWLPPVINYKETKTPLLKTCSKQKDGGEFTWLSGFLGSDRLFAQYYQLSAYASGNRLHSHSDIDEMFLVLEGEGMVKTNRKDFHIKQGDIITKPRGSGLEMQFIAGEKGILILDLEIWSDVNQTDVVHYSEHHELFLRGKGLNHVISTDGCVSGNDMMKHYSETYKRTIDGSKMFGE